MHCKNCSHEFDDNYCPKCGQKAAVGRINLKYLLNEVNQTFLQLDRGFFYTIWKLFTIPGRVIIGYLNGKRQSITKPLAFVLITSAIYVLITRTSGSYTLLEDVLRGFSTQINEGSENSESITYDLVFWLSNNHLYATLVLLPMYSLSSFIAFKFDRKNYFEHIIINLYISGQQIFIFSVYSLFFTKSEDEFYHLPLISIIMSVAYNFWVFYSIFNQISIGLRLLRILWMYVLYCVFLMILLMTSGMIEVLYGRI